MSRTFLKQDQVILRETISIDIPRKQITCNNRDSSLVCSALRTLVILSECDDSGIQVQALERPQHWYVAYSIGGRPEKDDFEITFRINEDLSNVEIYNWMRSIPRSMITMNIKILILITQTLYS